MYLLVPEGGLEPPFTESRHSFVDIAPTNKSRNTTSVLCFAQLLPKISVAHEVFMGYNNPVPLESLLDRIYALVSHHIYPLLLRAFRLNFALAHICAQGELDETFRPNCLCRRPLAAPRRRVCFAPQRTAQRASGFRRSMPHALHSVGA